MKKCFLNLSKIALTFAMAACCLVFPRGASAAEVGETVEVNSAGGLKYFLLNHSKNVSNISNIVLTSDICVNEDLNLDSSITIDLNNHTLQLSNPTSQIQVGKKVLVGQIPHQVYNEGHFEKQSKSTYHYTRDVHSYNTSQGNDVEFYNVWIPGYYTTEYKNQYKYDDQVSVIITNGTIKACNGCSGESKNYAYWLKDAHGKDGTITPNDLFNIKSGFLTLKNVEAFAGNGSNGGDATYSALWHVPFGGGDGGNGGNGADGGNLFFTEQGIVAVDSRCKLHAGKGGNCGTGSRPNPKFWVYAGSTGKNGKDGKDGSIINLNSKLLRI